MEVAELLEIARRRDPARDRKAGHVARQVHLPATLEPGLALVVQGVRHCGKSTWLAQLPHRFELPADRCLFVNFEDPRLAGHLRHETLTALVDAFETEVGPGPIACFLDEVQHVDGWHAWLRTELDTSTERRFVVTGE